MGIRDYGVGGHEDHITQEGDGGAQAHGGTVHRGDDGDFHIHQIPDELFGVPAEMIETFGVSERGKPSEIPSRRKSPSASGEDRHPRLVFSPQHSEQGS